jgi:hypothetical protein
MTVACGEWAIIAVYMVGALIVAWRVHLKTRLPSDPKTPTVDVEEP